MVSLVNMKTAKERSRDNSRRDITRAIQNGINAYKEDNGFFPPSSDDGKIIACGSSELSELLTTSDSEIGQSDYVATFSECEWGQDSLVGYLSDNAIYMELLPIDVRAGEGFSFRYISTGENFQVFTYLEGEEGAEQFQAGVFVRGLSCGDNICNFGFASKDAPLGLSLDEYEESARRESEFEGQ